MVDVSHGCFSGSLGQFDGLRLVWAQAAGYGILDYTNYGGPLIPNINYNALTEADFMGEWPSGAPDDPLVILLAHVEDDGRIKKTHCPYLADRLEELGASILAKSAYNSGAGVSWFLLTQQFIRGLRTAAAYDQDVVFS
jgi:hypothetical protein